MPRPAQVLSLVVAASFALGFVGGCRCEDEPREPPAVLPVVSAPPVSTVRTLYLPDASAESLMGAAPVAPDAVLGTGRCPSDMVDVAGRFCIDRFEASLFDERGRQLSPYYHPTPAQTKASFALWSKERHRVGPQQARVLPLPEPPSWQLTEPFDVVARSIAGSVPSGYMSGKIAQRACENAGKRLCSPEEWVVACRGESGRLFPYGETYADSQCNVHAAVHPARELHGDPSTGHLDPRLNMVEANGQPLLRPTGATTTCASRWGRDAVYDMVGNLDEWVDSPSGRFQGGFFSRDTTKGCEASVSSHSFSYFDYSLGTRCCR